MAAKARIECSMVIEVPGITEDELRAEVIAQVTDICKPLPVMEKDEVTVQDIARSWKRPVASTRGALDREVANGKLEKRKALNPDTGRECWAYRVSEGAIGGG